MAKSDIKVRILGENKTGAAFRKFKGDIDSTQNAVRSLRNQLIAAFGVRELVQAGDTFVNLQNRMGALTGTAAGTAEAMAHMKRIAIESRSDFDAVGDLFAKITFATKEMGLSQQQVADATQTVANTFIISGASAIEAANASRQLAQGLASGTLRGDELNSVMEQNSALAELLAKGLGVSTGKLRDMGAAGKITAENILPTLIAATDDTSKVVGNMNMTIGQSISVLKTNFITLVGEFEKSTGIFGKTANTVGFVATNMELLLVPTVALAVTAIPKLISMLNGLRLAMLANPAIALAAGLSALFVAMNVAAKESKTLDEQIEDLNNQIKTLEETGEFEIFDGQTIKAGEELLNQLIAQRQELVLLRDESGKTIDVFEGFQNNYENVIAKTKASIQITKDFADTVEGQLTNSFKNFFDATNKQFLDFKNLATSVAQAVINELINVFIVQKAVGMVKGTISDIQSGIEYNKLTDNDTLFDSFSGGGYTGKGIRAGGIDGRGGFPAILHPNETVIDHTKGQGMQAAPTVNFNISTVDAAGFDQLLASRKGLITSIINNAMNNQGKMGVV